MEMKWILLTAGIIANALASILIKIAMRGRELSIHSFEPTSVLQNIPLMAGLACFAFAFFLYAAVLTRLPLSIAHPIITSGSILVVGLCSVMFLGEQLSVIKLMSIFVIILGVYGLVC